MNKKVFTIGDYENAYVGYTDGSKWNGWATPYFTYLTALEVMYDYNEDVGEEIMKYDPIYDQFYILDKESGELKVWKGKQYATEEGIVCLYGIGAYSWVWDEITDYDIKNIAMEIEDFIWEHDTYHYQDECLDRMQTVEAIQKQLKELNTLKDAIMLLYCNSLTEELKYYRLGRILRV